MLRTPQIPCGRELARDSGGAVAKRLELSVALASGIKRSPKKNGASHFRKKRRFF
jgi:hypothetical protein